MSASVLLPKEDAAKAMRKGFVSFSYIYKDVTSQEVYFSFISSPLIITSSIVIRSQSSKDTLLSGSLNMDVTQYNVRNRSFFQSYYFNRSLYIRHSHTADMNITKYRVRSLFFCRHLAVFQIQDDSLLLDVTHYDITDTDILYDSSPFHGLT